MKKFFEDKNKRGGFIGSMIFIGLLILFCSFVGLTQPDPPIEEIEIPIIFEDLAMESEGGGMTSDEESAASSEQETVEETEEVPEEVEAEEVIEQQEDAEVVEDSGQESSEPAQTVDENKIPDFSNSGQGNGQTTGGNGSSNGSGDGDNNGDGDGDIGDGDHTLNGRSIIGKPSINDDFQEVGTIVLNVVVDRDGKVTRATLNLKESNTNSSRLFEIAKKAALKTKFNKSPGSAVLQTGTMTYNFTVH